ncbi:phospholipase [Aggregatibacter actinomycetemcomitans]|uniref:phospholipase n=1 Tax=Aggregatibacter actinomycetemcomitans TaxID=714 RepID=UPI0011D587CB|nr:phospholipase [Aggregatibacter actinomycetemcomitans]TYA29759.1 phospholipase [Aggregatibacter actinomycetemcomitans]
MLRKILIAFLLLITDLGILAQDDTPKEGKPINIILLAEVTSSGQKITGLALEYEDYVLSSSDLRNTYQVFTLLERQEQPRTIIRAYVNNLPEKTPQAKSGKFVIIEFDDRDTNANLYSLIIDNKNPMKFRAKDQSGHIIEIEKVQSTKIPQYYDEKLVYKIKQIGYVKLSNGKTIDRNEVIQNAERKNVRTLFIDDFSEQVVALNENNLLKYRFYRPHLTEHKKYPLTIFLHGSGQVGSDNIAHIISNKGAISTLQYEPGFVLAPQYNTIFDPFDDKNHGQKGGIHWQTRNRANLVLKMIDETVQQNPAIDEKRIYLIGLSRGSEGVLNLLLMRPNFFAGALLASGREARTIEWLDGNANSINLAPIKNVPMWFFHSKEDQISPVKGSRINYQILVNELNAKNVRYTEFSTERAGDNGILNNAHNTWEAVFNSPEVISWLLQQKRH